jgi:hypothetical protein
VARAAAAEEAVLAATRAALKALGNTQAAATDRALAESVPGGGGFGQRAALLAVVCVRERQILGRTEFVVGQRIKQLKGLRRRPSV